MQIVYRSQVDEDEDLYHMDLGVVHIWWGKGGPNSGDLVCVDLPDRPISILDTKAPHPIGDHPLLERTVTYRCSRTGGHDLVQRPDTPCPYCYAVESWSRVLKDYPDA